MNHMRIIVIRYLLIAICFIFLITDETEAANQDVITRLRQEIHEIEGRIHEIEEGRQGVILQLQELDRKIELRRRLVLELEKQVKSSSDRVKIINHRINELDHQISIISISLKEKENDLNNRRLEVGERISFLYRRLASRRIAILFGSQSPNDLLQRQKYLKAIERYDRSQIERLIESRDAVLTDRKVLEKNQNNLNLEHNSRLIELKRIQSLLIQRRNDEKQLTEEKSDKTDILERIRGDSELLRVLLEERRHSLKEIEKEINRLAEDPKQRVQDLTYEARFAELAGKLPWPLKNRKITIAFGSIRHPDLHTVTINPGIDLQAVPGDPVFSVAYGQVTRIAYLRGFGNTIILSHGEGYYTVYARLGAIFVKEGDITNIGQNIGNVGETGADGDFHFEIWSDRHTQDPLKWLSPG